MDAERMWCCKCGRERRIPPNAAWTPCACGCSSTQSWDPAASFVKPLDLFSTGPFTATGSLPFVYG